VSRQTGRNGSAGLGLEEPKRGKAWKPSQGFHVAFLLIGAGLSLSAQQVNAAKRDCAFPPAGLEEHCWREPCSFEIDIDGDRTQDRAVLVRERGGSHRRGIAIRSSAGAEVGLGCGGQIVLGAGRRVGALGADLSGAEALQVLRRHAEGYTDFGDSLLLASSKVHGGRVLLVVADRSWSPQVVDLTEPRHRLARVELLRSYDVRPAAPWLLPGLDDADEAFRLQTAAVLAESRVRQAVVPVAAWLYSEHAGVSPFTRAEIARTLGRLLRPLPLDEMGTPTWERDGHLDERSASAALRALESALGDAAPDVRWAAVEALGQLGGEAAATLVATCAEDKDVWVRRAVATTLGNLPGSASVAVLTKLLGASDRRIRLNAVRSVDRLRTQSAIPRLVKLLDDPDGVIRFAAAQALGNAKAEAAVPALLLLTKDNKGVVDWTRPSIPSHWLRLDCAAVQALQQIGDEHAAAEGRKRAPHCAD
jgi:HEAT repeat protein